MKSGAKVIDAFNAKNKSRHNQQQELFCPLQQEIEGKEGHSLSLVIVCLLLSFFKGYLN